MSFFAFAFGMKYIGKIFSSFSEVKETHWFFDPSNMQFNIIVHILR